MKKTTRHALFVAALLVPASLTLAQYRIDNGQARDANNRIGSSGFNTNGQLGGRINGLAGNYIVTGNVTGGRAFRGSIGYTDPTSFRGSLGSASFDSFLRDSVGASQMRGTSMGVNNMATLQPYFGAKSVTAPAGFARDPSSGTYYLPRAATGVTAGDGRIDFGGASRSQVAQGVLSAQRATGGAGLTSSPFASIGQRDQLTNLTRMSDFTTIARPTSTTTDGGLSVDTIGSGPRRPAAPSAKNGQQPGSASGTDASDSQEKNESTGVTGQGTTFTNLRAIDNNPQYAELRKRMEDRAKLPKLPGSEAAESLNKMNADIIAARQKEKDKAASSTKQPTDSGTKTVPPSANQGSSPAKEDGATDNKLTPTPPAPEDTLNLPKPKSEPVESTTSDLPLEINSLAIGVKDKNLGKLLADAEVAMKAGKFSTAIDAYDRAEEIANDDPLVFMGRAIAELGGGYYRSAELHFRQAFAADHALLMARFDLRSMLTDDRLNTLQADLAQIAKKNDKDSGPLLLLAFIYYNSGFPERSERALDMVQERSGGADGDAKLLKQSWFPARQANPDSTAPATGTATENK